MQGALIRFMKTGELGPLSCGLFREDVRRLLGDPLGWDGREALARDWRYEALSVDFDEDHRVIGYGLGFLFGQRLPDCLDDLAGRHYVDTTMEEVRQVLKAHGIAFEEGRSACQLRTAGGVWINEAGKDGKLMSMVYACPGPSRLSWFDERWRRPADGTNPRGANHAES